MSDVLLRVKVETDVYTEPENRFHCAIAHAIRRGDRDTVWVMVDRNRIKFSRRSTGQRYIFQTPVKAQRFIDALDNDEDVKPFILLLRDDDLLSADQRKYHNPDSVIHDQAIRRGLPVPQRTMAVSSAAGPVPTTTVATVQRQPATQRQPVKRASRAKREVVSRLPID